MNFLFRVLVTSNRWRVAVDSSFVNKNGGTARIGFFNVKILKLQVKEGFHLAAGQVLFTFELVDSMAHVNRETISNGKQVKQLHVFRADEGGFLEKLYINEGDIIEKRYLRF